jgi:hypothetical protein
MTEINRKSKELYQFSERAIDEGYFINIRDNEHNIYFNKGVVELCNLREDEYIHFINEGSEWMFYSSDNEDGFKLTRNKSSLRITSAPLIRMILKSTGFHKEKKFLVEKTNIIKDKCDVFSMNPKTNIRYMDLTNVNDYTKNKLYK